MDRTIFASEDVAFTEISRQEATALLGRTLPDGGGNTFYNLTPLGGPQTRGWMQVVGSYDSGSPSAAPSFHQTASGIEAGVDVANSEGGRIGAAIGYERASLSDRLGGSAKQDVFRASLYGSQNIYGLGLSASFTYATGREHTRRQTGFGLAASTRDSSNATGAVQLSAPLDADGFKLTPAVGILLSSLSNGAFIESNGNMPAFAVAGSAYGRMDVSPFVQIGISHVYTTADGLVITPDLLLGYRYDSIPASAWVTLTASDGTAFTDNGIRLSHSSALLGASITAHKGGWTGFVKYRAQVAGGWNDQRLEAGVRVAF